jgi:hypothetical protein
MNRHRDLIRMVMCCSWGLITLAAVFTSMAGVLCLGTKLSRILVVSLWVTCFVSATLTLLYDGAARIVAVIVLVLLFTLLLPTV